MSHKTCMVWEGTIYPDRRLPHGFRVIIAQTRTQFAKIWKDLGIKERVGGTLGCWIKNPRFGKGKLPNEVGILFFCRENMRTLETEANFVAHECMHAVFQYMRVLGKLKRTLKPIQHRQRINYSRDPKRIPEEFACYTHGWLVKRILKKLDTIRKAKAK